MLNYKIYNSVILKELATEESQTKIMTRSFAVAQDDEILSLVI